MILSEGFRIFYRRLASELHVAAGPDRALELVLDGPANFPAEDVRALAEALALDPSNGFGLVTYVRPGPRDTLANIGAGPHVVDLRALQAWTEPDAGVFRRSDVVFVRDAAQPRIRARPVTFDRNQRLAVEAATFAFGELADAAGYTGRGIEMPVRYLLKGFRAVATEFNLFANAENPRLSGTRRARFAETVAACWRYHGHPVHSEAVLGWLDQFNDCDQEAAVALLSHIHAVGYYETTEIAHTLGDLLQQHAGGAQLVATQRHGKSESKLLYELRAAKRTLPLAEALKGDAAHLVCVDDVVGSGDTIVKSLFGDPDGLTINDFGQWLLQKNRTMTVLTAVASVAGKNLIEGHPRSLGRVRVLAGTLLGTDEGVFSREMNVFGSPEAAASFRAACDRIGRRLFPSDPLGWGDCAWAIVTEYNVPDCSLPVIWAGDSTLPWKALFPRR